MNTIRNWILEDETPEVKYRAMTELLCDVKEVTKNVREKLYGLVSEEGERN